MEKNRFRDRNKRITDYTNANLFISNNANPFLISPYAPINTAQFAKVTVLNELQELISTTIGNISSIIDPINFSLKISTIYPADGATSSITLFGSTIIDDYLTVSGIADFNIINATTANLENITASTITSQYDITSLSSMTTNYMTVNDSLYVNDVVASTITSQYDITSLSSMTTNVLTSLEVIFSSLSCQPGVVSTATATIHSSILNKYWRYNV